MAACEFTISFSEDPDEARKSIEEEITENDGTISFSGDSGTFEIDTPMGRIEGELLISGQSMDVTITEKPGIIGCAVIKTYIQEYL